MKKWQLASFFIPIFVISILLYFLFSCGLFFFNFHNVYLCDKSFDEAEMSHLSCAGLYKYIYNLSLSLFIGKDYPFYSCFHKWKMSLELHLWHYAKFTLRCNLSIHYLPCLNNLQVTLGPCLPTVSLTFLSICKSCFALNH